MEKIVNGLQTKLASKLETADVLDRRKQDPWLLSEVMEQAEITIRSGLGRTLLAGISRGVSQSQKKGQFNASSEGRSGGLITLPDAVGAAKGAQEGRVKSEPSDDEWMKVLACVDGHGAQIKDIKSRLDSYQTVMKENENKWDGNFAEVKQLILTSAGRSAYAQQAPRENSVGPAMPLRRMGMAPPMAAPGATKV